MAWFSSRGRSRKWAYIGALVLAVVTAGAAVAAAQSVSAQGSGTGVTPPSAVTPDPAVTTLAFLGDDPRGDSALAWPELVADDIGVAFVDLSAAGSGFATGGGVETLSFFFALGVRSLLGWVAFEKAFKVHSCPSEGGAIVWFAPRHRAACRS